MYGDRFSVDQIERIKRAVTSKTFRRVTRAGTENHAMDFVSMGYLRAQYFPGETWNITQGPMTSQALMDLNRSRLPHYGHAAWLFWRQNEIVPTGFSDDKAEQLLRSSVFHQYEMDITQVASSSWRLPGPLNRIARGAEAPYEIRGASGEHSQWSHEPRSLKMLRYVWRDRNFAIGGRVGQKCMPDGYYSDYHIFNIVWESENRLRALEAMHPYWYSNSPRWGENYWRGKHSPFQQTGVHRNVAITMFNIPDKDPWPDRGRANWIAQRDKHFDNLIKLGQV